MVYGWKLRPGVELKDVTLEMLHAEAEKFTGEARELAGVVPF